MAITRIFIFPSNTLRGNDSIWFCGQKGHHFLPQRQMPFSPDHTDIKSCSLGRVKRHPLRKICPQPSSDRTGKGGWCLSLTHFSQDNRRGAHNSSWQSCCSQDLTVASVLVLWLGDFFPFLVPGIICGSIYKSKVLVINPTQVPEGVMPGKWFGKVSWGQSPKWF